jgi:hypothetical protein
VLGAPPAHRRAANHGGPTEQRRGNARTRRSRANSKGPSGSRKSGSQETRRWREQDSNPRSPARVGCASASKRGPAPRVIKGVISLCGFRFRRGHDRRRWIPGNSSTPPYRFRRTVRALDLSTLLGLPGSYGEGYWMKTTTNDALEQSAAARTSSDAVPLAGEPDARGDFR